jgi:hypothetical protein
MCECRILEGVVGIVTYTRLRANTWVPVRWDCWPAFDSADASTRLGQDRKRNSFQKPTDPRLAQQQGCVPMTRDPIHTNKREVGL